MGYTIGSLLLVINTPGVQNYLKQSVINYITLTVIIIYKLEIHHLT